jgi:hypothetical protein
MSLLYSTKASCSDLTKAKVLKPNFKFLKTV